MASKNVSPATPVPTLPEISAGLHNVAQKIFSVHTVLWAVGDETTAANVCDVACDSVAAQYEELMRFANSLDRVIESTKAAPLVDEPAKEQATEGVITSGDLQDELLAIASKLNSCLQVAHALAEDAVDDHVAAAELLEDTLRQQYEIVDGLTGRLTARLES